MITLNHVDLFAPGSEAEGHHLSMLGKVLIGSHRQHLGPLPRFQDTVEVIYNYFLKAVGALDGEHGVISEHSCNIVEEAAPAEFMAAVLEPVGTVRFRAANPTNVGIDHFLFGDCEGLDQMHQVVKGFLDIQSTSLQKQGHAVDLQLNKS